MASVFTHQFDTPTFKGEVSFSTGLYINGKFVDGVKGETIEVFNPATGKPITRVSAGTKEDVDIAVKAAQEAFDNVWGYHTPGHVRGNLLLKLADLVEKNADKLAAVETLDNGKAYNIARHFDVMSVVSVLKYYAGWADKVHGQTIETDENKFAFTKHEPIGVVGQIIPWNYPLGMLSWKIGPALATGNTIVLKPSENTPLSALLMCTLVEEAGFPPGVLNIVNGYGKTAGQAIAEHMEIEKVAFTGSVLTGRRIMEAAARTNMKKVTLELGGKSPAIVFDDADLEQAVKWCAIGIFSNSGQVCCASSRIFVHEAIYDKFVDLFTKFAQQQKLGDPFAQDTVQGPQISDIQFDRIMGYIEAGKKEGATVHIGGKKFGTDGYFVEPTIFTEVKPDMKIAREEIFGPVAAVAKFKDEADVVRLANDTTYGLAAAIFTKDITRGLQMTGKLRAGSIWVNATSLVSPNVPFGGYKQSGIGRELGQYALDNYTNVKAVHVNLGL